MDKIVLDQPVYIVGIGASAGGLDAIKEFFDHLPVNTHMSFIIVQHLSPNFKSLMNELLSKHTHMQILLAEDQMEIRPDHIYLNRNDKNIKIKDKKIHLIDKSPKHSLNLPIDLFFHSLGEEYGEKAIAVVLSGTGTDGSRGIKTIKEAGGTIMIQDPETAQFNGMPNMALNTDLGEIVASPKDLAEKILLLPQHTDNAIHLEDDYHVRVFSEILNFIEKKSTVDFSLYKEKTLIRRLKKRINILNYKNLSQYLDFLRKSPDEWTCLYKDFLIGVTNFFRDPEAFESLIKNVFPPLTANRNPADTIRIWVPGCSTGEEAYSLALALDLFLKQNKLIIDYKIFATDIDQQALLKASSGIFPVNIFTDVPEHYLNSYFIKVGDEFQIIKQIREKIIFSQHNLVKDPPFIRIDMISCRNLLIYIKSETQARLLRNFQFSLVYKGYLFLGSSENIGLSSRDFEVIDDNWRIFRNISEQKTIPATFAIELKSDKRMKSIRGDSFVRSLPKLDRNFFQEILTTMYSPSCLFFDSDYQVLYSHGDIRKYLNIPDGVFSASLMDMINHDLAAVIRNGVRRISKGNNEVYFKGLSYEHKKKSLIMDLKIQKPPLQTKSKTLYLLEFTVKDNAGNESLVITGEELGGIQDQRIEDLDEEIRRINEEKQNIVEDLETSNEELQASNEELMASNEELQSTNEELQSVNEELYTVNTELQSKNKELEDLTLDIDNLLVSTQIGTLFLDKNLKVRKFTPELKKVFHLEENDIGRSINDFAANFMDISSKEILEAAQNVMETRKPEFREIQSLEKKVYYKRITPYINKKKEVDGVVLTFIDITKIYETEEKLKQKNQEIASQNEEIMAQNEELKTSYDEIQRVNQDLLESEKRFKDIFEQAAQGIAYLGFNGQILMANNEFLRIFGYREKQPSSLTMQRITHPDDLQLEMELFNDIFTGKSNHYSIEKRGIRSDGSEIWIKVTNSLSTRQNLGDVNLISIVSDITERKKTETRIKEAKDLLEYQSHLLENINDAVISTDRDFNIISLNQAAIKMYGWKLEEIKGQNVSKILQTSFSQSSEEVLEEFFTTGIWQGEVVQYTKNKQKLYIYSLVKLIKDPLDQQDLVVAVNRDITEKVEFKNKYYRSEETFELAINAVDDGLWDWNIETGKVYYSPRWAHILGFKPDEVPSEYQSWTSRIHPDDKKQVDESLQKHLRGEVSQFVCEHRLKTKQGEFLWVLGRGKVVEFKKNTPLRAIGTMTDISKQKEYEGKILQITREQKQILDSISDGFFVLDNDFVVRLFNYAAERLLGRKQKEVLNHNLFESFPEAKGSIFEEKYTRAIKTKQPTHFETYFNQAPYENWYDVRVYPHESGISIFFQVVTEARKAQQLLEESLKEKEILLREIHHRIKNNLQIVSSLISLQSNRLEEPELKEFLFNLETRIQSMSLIHKSLYESERLSNINLKNYIEPLVKNIQSIYQKKVKLVFDVEEITLPIDLAVPLALIINEVISNSFKHAFCLSGNCQITLKLQQNEQNYILSISDNGKGLPDNFYKDKSESMGYLLIDNLVEQLSGEISFKTNGGTMIQISFPVEKESIIE